MTDKREKPVPDVSNLYNAVPRIVVEEYDVMALTHQNYDLPRFREHDAVIALARQFKPVHRKRISRYSTDVVRRNGEDIWIVGNKEMPRSQMIALAWECRNLPGKWVA